MVDDEGLDRTAATFDLEARAVDHVVHRSDQVAVLRIIGRQIVVV